MAWTQTAIDLPPDKCIHQLFEAQAERTPHACAVIFKDRQLTYRELNERANALAHKLAALSVGAESLVGICVERSPEMLVGVLAVLKAGAAYIPLDPSYPDERLRTILSDARPGALLTQRHLLSRLPNPTPPVIFLDDQASHAREQAKNNLAIELTSANLAYVIFTSGSTGKPKGVLVSHGSLVNHAVAMGGLYELRPSDRVLQFASFSFDVAAEEIVPTWLAGGTVVLWPVASGVAPIKYFLDFVEDQRITILNLPASYWHEWVLELAQVKIPSTIRLVVVGSDKVLSEKFSIWQKTIGERVRLCNAYGPTETTITATLYEPSAATQGSTDCLPIGRPIGNTRAYVLDESLNRVPAGAPGELHIGGAGLARGYLNLSQLTAEKFIPDPFSKRRGDRLYRTGDLVRRLPDGNLEFLGRTDDQVKIRGYRIETGEIETALHQYPEVQSAVVIAREDEPGERQLVAYCVGKNGARLSPDMLRRFLRARLPKYMVPRAFVPLKQLPLTSAGKVDRRQLPSPVPTRAELDNDFVAPRNEIESILAEIWEGMLGVKPGIRDNFFELGGHSLLLVRLANQIEKKLRVNLALTDVFHARTIEGLARLVGTKKNSSRSQCLIHPYQTEGDGPPVFCHGGSEDLGRYLGEGQPLYWLDAHGMNGFPIPDTIEEMAAHYFTEIRLIQPSGPYCLLGYSLGGLVMFELAHELLKQGEKIDLLVLIDPSAPYEMENTPVGRALNRSPEVAANDVHSFRSSLRQNCRRVLRGLSWRFGRSKTVAKKLFCEACLSLGYRLPPFLRLFYFLEKTEKIVARYTAKVYPGSFVLFRRPDNCTESQWRGLALGEVEIHDTWIDHNDFLEQPYVQILAAQIKDHLQRVQAMESREPQGEESRTCFINAGCTE
ncbi:MAG: amino acid adenylation domain-containing protein [Candidatus Binatia bacterium]